MALQGYAFIGGTIVGPEGVWTIGPMTVNPALPAPLSYSYVTAPTIGGGSPSTGCVALNAGAVLIVPPITNTISLALVDPASTDTILFLNKTQPSLLALDPTTDTIIAITCGSSNVTVQVTFF